jgi:ATP-binding protein involved in chromosome partitioning
LAAELGVPLLGRVPLDPAVREWGDAGEPVVAAAPESEAAQAIVAIADAVRALERGRGIVTKSLPLVS